MFLPKGLEGAYTSNYQDRLFICTSSSLGVITSCPRNLCSFVPAPKHLDFLTRTSFLLPFFSLWKTTLLNPLHPIAFPRRIIRGYMAFWLSRCWSLTVLFVITTFRAAANVEELSHDTDWSLPFTHRHWRRDGEASANLNCLPIIFQGNGDIVTTSLVYAC